MPPETRLITVTYTVNVDLAVEVDDNDNTTVIGVIDRPYITPADPDGDVWDRGVREIRGSSDDEWTAGANALNDGAIIATKPY